MATTDRSRPYPVVDLTGGTPRAPKFPDIEQTVLDYWDADGTFVASIDNRADAPEFVFYDGPPFANGLPHYGHLLTGYVKDVVPRFQTMLGKRVERRFGWDTHGLPAELEAERQLGITDKSQIEQMGVDKFNEYCRDSVLRYTGEWRSYVHRQARWVDFDNDYKTLDLDYMESVMWAFKELYDKGLVYQGYRVLPYSWYEQTPLSNQESKLDDAYKMRQDPALTVTMPLHADGELAALDGVNALIWTTTPWTLPSNLAIAVHPDVEYSHVRTENGEEYLLATALLGSYTAELGEVETLGTYAGKRLAGLSYTPPFDFFAGHMNSHVVLLADYVTTDSGTGVVHLAPAFGEEDMDVATANGIEVVRPLDEGGRFTAEVPPYEGQMVFDANAPIIKDLKKVGRVLRHETIEHSYPHSWRSGQPLIYMAVPSWFVAVTKIRDRMVELNQEINWTPEHIRDGQFGKWLEGARDWNISRNRYWGAPIPVWMSDDPAHPRIDVYGSLDELERDFGVRPDNLHRPHIDELTRPNPDDPTGKSTMRRVPEVLDCWFESGSMPYAQVHYPFENREWFDGAGSDSERAESSTGAGSDSERAESSTGGNGEIAHNPGDFIVEYNGQTRGWFYNLHVLSTALFDRPAFRNVSAHGIVLGNDGQKMSKSKRNYPDVNEVFDRDGSDAMRWFLMASPILRGGNLVVTEQGIREGVRQALLPLWNAYSFLQLYAERPATWRTDSDNLLDRYILAKLAATRDEITQALETYDISGACDSFREFCESLTNWYVRRSRARFWTGQDEDPAAFDTLYTVLEVASRLAAPLLPLATEAIWRGLTGERSVHLTDWPSADELPRDEELVAAMDEVRAVCSVTSSVRKANKLRVRLPLPQLTIAAPTAARLAPYTDLVADEMNVKSVVLRDDPSEFGRSEVVVNARAAGPRLGKDVQRVIKAVKSGNWQVRAGADGQEVVVADGIELIDGEYTRKLVATAPDSTAELPGGAGLVVLDTTVTPELEAEGWAKDRVRELQEARRDMDLDISDRIVVRLVVPVDRADTARTHSGLIADEVLAVEFEVDHDGSAGAIELGDGVTADIRKA
ncbi:MAG TPA: isoleucine--tRNA ligase [Gordonia sp. (in: high G+C Gram-positive bacteria)]|uniref:isoleucine--tRNA ligase n=1 Tax=unclassified Gordonia (in: high G+C Gram-positive bacteria) TaxID=2657482 RepID=UPI000FBD327E|nr:MULTISPECIES: isoleucine--tRNA ligase [unclassified Gordonia (in: high G+C Gram-positive bacteria)]RUP35290.1 MAG: isoleucine--tRNA ligase [Gordonia sp. (in: high G+C Gram-positive bacteria)]HNP58979.1 isoleucine--tRNA ligase [Gordonia sp. (in: high G+C Gram-positive bacteria)]HRC52705.1 isoleucine--tRNA ligase [Gordonia sp. (in: high G+C Gram-positive bacteria)]